MHIDITANYFASKQFFPTVSAYAELHTMRLRRSLKLLNFVFLQAPKTLVTTIKPPDHELPVVCTLAGSEWPGY